MFEVQHIKWKFNIIHHPKFNELDMAADGLRLIKKYRLSPTHGYEKCLGPKDRPEDLAFCVCNVGRRDGASYLFGDQSNSDSAGLVHMIDKDDVQLVRWTHGTSGLLRKLRTTRTSTLFSR